MYIKILVDQNVNGSVFEYTPDEGNKWVSMDNRPVTIIKECSDVSYYTQPKKANQGVDLDFGGAALDRQEVLSLGDIRKYANVLFIDYYTKDGEHKTIVGYGIDLYIMNDEGKTIDSEKCYRKLG